MAQKKEAHMGAKEPVEEVISPQQAEKKPIREPVVCFFTANGVRVNSENQPIDEYGNILDETPLPRG